MIKIGMCDDELNSIKYIAKIIESAIISYEFNAEIVCITSDQKQIFDMIKEKQLDVLFLDINFKNAGQKNGTEFAKDLRELNKDFYLIFLTSYSNYQGVCYDYKTFRFLQKPGNKEVIFDYIKALKDEFEFNPNKLLKLTSSMSLNIQDIVYIEKSGVRATIYTNTEGYTIYRSLDALEKQLPDSFLRSHKSYIINRNKVTLTDSKNKIIKLLDKFICPIGRKYANIIEKLNK